MVKKFEDFIRKHWDIVSYLIFGVLTTVVNYLVYIPCFNWLHLSATLSNVIAWAVSVAFAYLTNKPFVFKSYDWSHRTVLPELAKFVGCRLGSGALETAFLLITVDIMGWNGNYMKLIISVFVVAINYVGSKLLVFRKKQ